jgi:hypothetical protein
MDLHVRAGWADRPVEEVIGAVIHKLDSPVGMSQCQIGENGTGDGSCELHDGWQLCVM